MNKVALKLNTCCLEYPPSPFCVSLALTSFHLENTLNILGSTGTWNSSCAVQSQLVQGISEK